MSETIETVGATARDVEARTIRVPRQIMALLEQSYGTRERILDWCLALVVSGALVFAFRDQLSSLGAADTDPNVGRSDDLVPNNNLAGAFPASQGPRPDLYTYNMPTSRVLRYHAVPSANGTPSDPSANPCFP